MIFVLFKAFLIVMRYCSIVATIKASWIVWYNRELNEIRGNYLIYFCFWNNLLVEYNIFQTAFWTTQANRVFYRNESIKPVINSLQLLYSS